METPKLSIIKKELIHLEYNELSEIILKISKFKTENKEFLNYLLFYQDQPEVYIEELKTLITDSFNDLNGADYQKLKKLRKVVRLLNKHLKFVAIKRYDVEMSIFFCNLFIENKLLKTRLKALQNIFLRQIIKAQKLTEKLDEDLKFDYNIEIELLLTHAQKESIFL
ncbi:hypothetical protein [Pseudopedobacter beijingensis]|uniref:Uncharacterized protein n=1 Tax=Pseudopedobacter beijingensis TaxID=1207056 RepID=A0ABW4IJ03_9SPHI